MAKPSASVQEINGIMRSDSLADYVTNKYVTWLNSRTSWIDSTKELRNYIFQTDTTQTSNASLPWKNKTSIPKICQIRDNLHANYYAALFPHDEWFKWEASSEDATNKETATLIESYMRQKVRESGFKKVVSDMLYDYIDYGNSFGEVGYESKTHTTSKGVSVSIYNGPKLYRLSPTDILFDLSAGDFESASKVTRTVVSLGSLKQAALTDPAFAWVPAALANTVEVRTSMGSYRDQDIDKSEGLTVDGFGSLSTYYSSDMVELLEYEGDTFDNVTGEIKSGRRVIIMDRRKVVLDEAMDSWLGKSNKEHVGWRPRPDNLLAMGPLDNLVGMQYRLDHLENLKADVFDQIAHPVTYQRGNVEDWVWGPGEKIFGDIDSNVQILSVDSHALNADFQIAQLMQNMEELVGAPRQAMGIRTPGEKTAFEVQALENNAGRIFQQKILQFEEYLIEPLLNQMLEQARRNATAVEIVSVLDEDIGVQSFLSISPETLNAKGKLWPIGARHFAKQAQTVQNLLGFINSAAYADPAVATHVSGFKIAEIMEENLGLAKLDLVQRDIRVAEQKATAAITSQAKEEVAGEILDRPEPQ
jgi:hypothetical protein